MDSAFVCDRKKFRYIYELEKRRSDRAWHSTYLVKIELAGENELAKDQSNNGFIKILTEKMRSADILYQWDKNIFLLLLSDLKHEDATKIVERISDSYFKNRQKEEPGLEVRLWPLKSC